MGLRSAYYFVMINAKLTVAASLLRVVRRVVFLATSLANVGIVVVTLGLGIRIGFITLFGEIDKVIHWWRRWWWSTAKRLSVFG